MTTVQYYEIVPIIATRPHSVLKKLWGHIIRFQTVTIR